MSIVWQQWHPRMVSKPRIQINSMIKHMTFITKLEGDVQKISASKWLHVHSMEGVSRYMDSSWGKSNKCLDYSGGYMDIDYENEYEYKCKHNCKDEDEYEYEYEYEYEHEYEYEYEYAYEYEYEYEYEYKYEYE